MKHKDWTVCAIFLVISVIGSVFVVSVSANNECVLKYKKHVDDKPNFFVTTSSQPGICRISYDADNSTSNYHVDRKYAEEIRPETVIGGLSYDARNGSLLYWAKVANLDHSRLYRVRLNDSHWERILDQDDDFRDTAYDWASRNLYVIMGSRSLLVAVHAEQPWYPSVIIYDRSQLTSLAVHPNKAYLFFVETSFWRGARNKICRAHLDGSGVRELAGESRYYVTSLAIDYHADRLYWSVPALNKIQHSALDGSDVRSIGAVRVYSSQLDLSNRALAVDKHYVYYRSAEANVVQRVEKASGAKDPDFELANVETAPITEIIAYTYKSQKIRKDHPCKLNRGGCEKYCFAVPQDESLKRVCKCSFTDVLADDGVSCVLKRQPVTS